MGSTSPGVVIVGGGLSGLYAAHLLERHGVHDYVLLEARSVFGGRIVSTPAGTRASAIRRVRDDLDRFDLGPAWFWPELQPRFDAVVRGLKLERFEQHASGDVIVERARHEAPMRANGYATSPQMRLVGGMAMLTDALRARLPAENLLSGHRVNRLRCSGEQVKVEAETAPGDTVVHHARLVMLAVPPRLVAASIDVRPALTDVLLSQWRHTPTWMAAHAKYVAVYEQPFWRDEALSGEGRSALGPLVEIHDASMPGGQAALFGFLGVPAAMRRRIPEDELRAHSRAQLARMFGPRAASPVSEFIKDWAADPFTAIPDDERIVAHHHAAPAASPGSGAWARRLIGIASEWSPQFPGYLAGAVEAAELGVRMALAVNA